MKQILVVDDNKTNLMTAKTVLSQKYKVTPVMMGEQALKFLEANHCDLILLDIDMPGMDGFEVLQKIKDKGLDTMPPVLFLTGNSDGDTLGKCILLGGIDVMVKPFISQVLLNRVDLILELTEYRMTK